MYTETQNSAEIASIEDDMSLENQKLRQDLESQNLVSSDLRAQLDDTKKKFQEFHTFHEKVKSMMAQDASKVVSAKNATIESLKDELENKRWECRELIDEIRDAGEEEEKTNQALRLQLEQANKQVAMLSEQRERDKNKIEALEQELDAAKHNASLGVQKTEVPDFTTTLKAMTRRALQNMSTNQAKEGNEVQVVSNAAGSSLAMSTRSATQSRIENEHQTPESQTGGAQVRANLTNRQTGENVTPPSNSCDHTGILLGIVNRNIADYEAEKFGRGAEARNPVQMYQGLKYERRDWFFAGSGGHHSRDSTTN
ncbi:hypothetical protein BKA64DRAFT_745029 [Cadophora sp. MPI-SDFR-AT-0126]|nr:hypothetical protein BKA64DRAFT_745029 [Leotiomycetes sp. MPI-SDFR-AT-0126]